MVGFCRFRVENIQALFIFPVEVIILGLFISWNGGLSNLYRTKIVFVYLLFVLYRIVISPIRSHDASNFSKISIYYEAMILLILVSIDNADMFIEIGKLLRNIGVISSVLGCYEFITKSSLFIRFIDIDSRVSFSNVLGTTAARTQTFFMHPIICAVYCTFTWILLLYIPYQNNIINVLAKILTIICLMGTQSRSSWISFALIMMLHYGKKLFETKKRIDTNRFIYVGLGIICMIVLYVIFNDYFNYYISFVVDRFEKAFDVGNSANYNRVSMIKLGLHKYSEMSVIGKLFGGGRGYAKSILLTSFLRNLSTSVDNTYLMLLLDYGVLGIAFMFYFIILAIKAVSGSSEIMQMCGYALISVCISGFFYDMLFYFTATSIMAFCLCGINITNETIKQDDNNLEKLHLYGKELQGI